MQINRQSYEEYFLLYADGELNESEKRAVEEFIDQNPDLAGELSIIQETVFKPDDSIMFENKELLFRDKSQGRKVIYMRWFRVAAAAAILLGFSLAGWIFMGDKNMRKPPLAVVKTPESKKATPGDHATAKTEQVAQENASQKKHSQNRIPVIARSKREPVSGINAQTNTSTDIQRENKETPMESDVTKNMPELPPAEGAAFTQDVVRTEAGKETIDVAVEPRAMDNSTVEQPRRDVSYAQSFPQEEDDMIYFANTSLTKKTKLRGVLRKATRYLDRVTSLQ